MELIDRLQEFGLTRQGASLYLCLLSEGDLNGYELCKHTGISRSNVYTGLASLVSSGAAWLIEGDSTRYRAVPAAEFTANRLRQLSESREQVVSDAPSARGFQGGYVTIKGEGAIIDRMRNLVMQAGQRLYLSVEPVLLKPIWPELVARANAGVKVVVITREQAIPALKVDCPAITIYSGEPEEGQVKLIIDSSHVLTGEIARGQQASCLYSSQKNLVDLVKSALKNEIRLTELGRNPKPQEE